MERLEVKDQEGEFEQLPGNLTLDIIIARRQDDNKRKADSILQANWTMAIRIYRKAGYKALKNTNKNDQVSCNGANRYTHT